MAKRHKAVLCDTRFQKQRTCAAKQSPERSVPCPRCEGYRAGWIINNKIYYQSQPDREFVGWTPRNGIQVPIYTDGKRPRI